MLADILIESGADVSYIRKVDEKTGHAIIQVDSSGQNAIFLCGGANEMITDELVDSVLEQFGRGDIILLQNEINNVKYIIEKASRKNMCIIFNPSPLAGNIELIDFSVFSYIILNEIEAFGISGSKDPEGALEYFRAKYPELKVLLTLGENGSIYDDGITRIE
jgi:ribokinase